MRLSALQLAFSTDCRKSAFAAAVLLILLSVTFARTYAEETVEFVDGEVLLPTFDDEIAPVRRYGAVQLYELEPIAVARVSIPTAPTPLYGYGGLGVPWPYRYGYGYPRFSYFPRYFGPWGATRFGWGPGLWGAGAYRSVLPSPYGYASGAWQYYDFTQQWIDTNLNGMANPVVPPPMFAEPEIEPQIIDEDVGGLFYW